MRRTAKGSPSSDRHRFMRDLGAFAAEASLNTVRFATLITHASYLRKRLLPG